MTYDEGVPLSQHGLLRAQECEECRDHVMSLKDHWTWRGGADFFTLGAASYLDAQDQYAAYADKAKSTNPWLLRSFGGLLERVRSFFGDLLGEHVFFDLTYALPGFHIFIFKGEDQSGSNATARAHFDLQWMTAIPDKTPSATLSFTLPIEQPSGGASMEIWHARYQNFARLGVSAHEYAANHASQVIQYVPGRIVVHDGLALHAIGRAFMARPEGLRVTLQGHGIRLPQGWLLYW